MTEAGKLAFSKAGRDKGTLYLIIRQERDTLWLADGVRRGVLTPKQKNRKHVQMMNRSFDGEELEQLFKNPAWGDNLIRERLGRTLQEEKWNSQ